MTLEPSDLIKSLLTGVSAVPSASAGMQAMMTRGAEFPGIPEAQLTGIALDPRGRELAERLLDRYWANSDRQTALFNNSDTSREVIIGSGFHAATYAATRVLSGYPRPLVVERDDRVGGTFALTERPTFYLNSRNRPGAAGLAGDQGASLNYLPGAPIQASNLSMMEYQTNTDMAFVIRLTLAQYADVLTGTRVDSAARNESGIGIGTPFGELLAGRVIDARGSGDPSSQGIANGTTILTFPQFMKRMDGIWPLRGLRRVAVVGGGDSGKCAVESLLGVAPQPFMATNTLDRVERVDWYSEDLPTTCDVWQGRIRGRYQAIGRYLRSDRFGVRRLNVINRRTQPVAIPDAALMEGRAYDLTVMCTGSRETGIDGLNYGDFDTLNGPGGVAIATRGFSLPAYRIGPHAQLPFSTREVDDGIADISANAVSMFRTANKTATLAATLPAL